MLLGVLAVLVVLVVHGLPGISTQMDLAILSVSQAYAERFVASPAGPAFLLPSWRSAVGSWRASRPACWRCCY